MEAVVRMHHTLQRDFGWQDWRLNLRAGPECIGILGQCLLITSRSDLIGIKLSGPGLEYETLFANISDCAEFGMETFRKTGEKMTRIASLSNELANSDGIIEKMLKFCNSNQDARRDRHLRRYILLGRKSVDECVVAINEIKEAFDKWSKKTSDLFKALEEAVGNKKSEAEQVKNEIVKSEKEKKQKEETREAEEKRLQAHYKAMEIVREKKEWYEDQAAKLVSAARVAEGGLAAAVASVSAVAISGNGLVLGVAAASIHYLTLKGDLSRMEEDQARREMEIKGLMAKAVELQAALQKLSSEKSSIAEVMEIVRTSVYHLTALQAQINSFMDFLKQISTIIDLTVNKSNFVYDIAEDTDGLIDTGIKKDLLDNAFDMRTRFHFVARASEIYKTISAQYIIPTIDKLPQLRLVDDGTDEEINSRLAALNTLRVEICLGAEEKTAKMHTDLKKDLRLIAQMSVVSFEPVQVSEGQDH
ncbi:hypothetical protein TSTA_110570 [Talaromyces stipitatus ATCC 10500]|uniref:Uncharacterized protein n=1 Tax=Talaromyces stipitatus (strain ATCC 10500 / CBS 375.48 / QM 6759 / NRRL 1006) TaxID=441959 RepID=B8MUW0_TALSN|nr:uncharacterized protein TSTA_110570 [Talaromyces stipitatus ATCC 10500]EED11877.1 hypothetical protein TSTA_110570 [Talaromyces stipitatus ATCC 10500]